MTPTLADIDAAIAYQRSQIDAAIAYQKLHRAEQFFRTEGPLRRELYAKHVEFFSASKKYKEVLFMAANRCGKTISGAYASALHATGEYPDWWPGRRFKEPTDGWACGTTSQTTRDIVQSELFGKPGALGTGMIPADRVIGTTARSGIAEALETVRIKHKSGGVSTIGLKSYEQGRKAFEGTSKHWIWDDEEPPLDIYTEQLYRTTTTRGIVYITFTPLQGMSDVVKSFLEPEKEASREFKKYVQAGWGDVPHIDPEEKRALLATTPPYLIAARTDGEPALGVGAIYPIAESDITVDVFEVPVTWPRAYGMDVGWNRTAAIWGAQDPGSGVIYLYDEHYLSEGAPPVHAHGIRSRGEWIPGVIDPASRGRSQRDGMQLLQDYMDLGLQLSTATNAVTTGIDEIWTLLVSGRLKIMGAKCQNWLREFRKYHRDEKGHIVKKDDHLMDATKYLILSGRERMCVKPMPKRPVVGQVAEGEWMSW